MQFTDGAKVLLPGRAEAGRLKRVIIDPKTLEITHIVVHTDNRREEEKVIPIQLVAYSTGEEIVLKELPGGWNELAPFRESDYRLVNNQDLFLSANLMDHSAPILFIYPHVIPDTGFIYPRPEIFDPFSPLPRKEVLTESQAQPVPTASQQHLIPGSRVISQDNVELGYLEQVITNPEDDQNSCFILKRGLLIKERKFVPLSWIEEIRENVILLGVRARFLDWLPDELEP